MSYTQLTQEQRYQIYALKKTVRSQTEIAQFLDIHKSTINRELRRNAANTATGRNRLTAKRWCAERKCSHESVMTIGR